MITVTFTDHRLDIDGHANTAPKGEDIVCASVSVLAHTLIYGLEHVIGLAVTVAEMSPGIIRASWVPDRLGPEGVALIKTVRGSMEEIAKRYPGAIELRAE